MSNTKTRYSVTVAGVPLSILTDESEEFLTRTADDLSAQIKMITSHSFCISKLDAAILCALDALGEKAKVDAKVRELEAELSVLRMEAENTSKSDSANENKKNMESFLERKINGQR